MSNDDGESRAAAINAVFGPFIFSLIDEAKALADSPMLGANEKRLAVLAVADKFSGFINTQTECRTGCSHCCYQAVAVSKFEAQLIANHINEPPQRCNDDPSHYLFGNAGQEKYAGVPCSFLKAGRCSIYPVRPMACKLHHSLNPTSDHCKVGEYDGLITAFNVFAIHLAFFNAKPFEGVADIREYFPSKEPQ